MAFKVTGGWIVHADGTAWYTREIPPRRHGCHWATYASLDYGNREVERCSCGGLRIRYLGGDWSDWRERNSVRRHTAHSLTTF